MFRVRLRSNKPINLIYIYIFFLTGCLLSVISSLLSNFSVWMCRRSPLSATACLKYPKSTLARGYSSSACPWSKWWAIFLGKIKASTVLLFYCCVLLTHLFFCPFWRFEIEIEPIFASLALYDVKEKKKVSCYAFLSVSLVLSCVVTSANCWESKTELMVGL